ncbi:MAG: hypothetical protein C4518_08330 [Desulfobacteraceae bacterium]|nr:MAG: hypothetical protein C4518_08330 [Desulfobacteraceae bacterium]
MIQTDRSESGQGTWQSIQDVVQDHYWKKAFLTGQTLRKKCRNIPFATIFFVQFPVANKSFSVNM